MKTATKDKLARSRRKLAEIDAELQETFVKMDKVSHKQPMRKR